MDRADENTFARIEREMREEKRAVTTGKGESEAPGVIALGAFLFWWIASNCWVVMLQGNLNRGIIDIIGNRQMQTHERQNQA